MASGPSFADGQDLALFEKTQELGLDVERHVANLVEEERPARGRPDEALLVGHRTGEAAAPVAEQLAVGQLARHRGAVERQEGRGAPRRSRVDRPRDQVLPGAALAGDEHGQRLPLHALNLVGDAGHGGAGADEAGQQRFERALAVLLGRLLRALAQAAQLESLARDRGEQPEAAALRLRDGAAAGGDAETGAVGRFVEQRCEQWRAVALRAAVGGRSGERQRLSAIAAAKRQQTGVAAADGDEGHDRAHAGDVLHGGDGLPRQQVGQDRRVGKPRDDGVVGGELERALAARRHPHRAPRAPWPRRPDRAEPRASGTPGSPSPGCARPSSARPSPPPAGPPPGVRARSDSVRRAGRRCSRSARSRGRRGPAARFASAGRRARAGTRPSWPATSAGRSAIHRS